MKRTAVVWILVASVLAFSGCGRRGPAERAGEKVDRAAEEAREKMRDTMTRDTTRDTMMRDTTRDTMR